MDKITLSPSKLSLLRECPRCFYDANVLKIVRPRGIFPSLPGGIDRMMKKYTNEYRGSLPPFLVVPGVLFPDASKIKKWQYWKTAPRYSDPDLDVEVYGAIDDLLVQPDGSVDPLDFKTKGGEPKDDGSQYYQLQMDIYNLLFSVNGFKVNNRAFLAYLWPEIAADKISTTTQPPDADELITVFKTKVFTLECSVDRALETIKRACEVLRGPRPESDPTCEMCKWARDVAVAENE